MDFWFFGMCVVGIYCCGTWFGYAWKKKQMFQRHRGATLKIIDKWRAQPMELNICTVCGHIEVPDSLKCDECGHDLKMRWEKTQHRVECAWCGEILGNGIEPVSHGICWSCAHIHFELKEPLVK